MEINSYNDMPLEEARIQIIRRLIKKDAEIDEDLKLKKDALDNAELRMVTAKMDGDASENSALESAIDDIRRIRGEIDSLMVLRGRLDNITECDYKKGKYNYKIIIDILKNAMSAPDKYIIATELLELLDDKQDLYNSLYNIKAGDVKALELRYSQYASKDNLCNEDKELLLLLDSLYNISKLRKYKPTGICLVYSTVRVLVDDGNTKTIFTGFICPEGISFIEDGIFAANSQLAKLLIGNSMSTNQFVNGKIRYTLLELY